MNDNKSTCSYSFKHLNINEQFIVVLRNRLGDGGMNHQNLEIL